MDHPYESKQKNIEDEGRVENLLEHVDDLQEAERRFEGIKNPYERRRILENIPDIHHVKEHDGLHDGFRKAMYHMDEYEELYERRILNHPKKDQGER